MSTIADVARHAGVSVSTISNVLNGRVERMRGETLERVRELCALRNLPRFPGAREELRAAIDRVRELRESREPDHADFI